MVSGSCAVGLSALAQALPGVAAPSLRVSVQQLQRVVDERFPLRYSAAGVLDLRIQAPRLGLLPEQNRIASVLALEASGQSLRRNYSGDVDLDFELRYEPSDRTIRAHRIRVQAVRLPGLAPDASALIEAYARASAQKALLEVVLHTLRPQDLALANTMGFEPGTITVTDNGLLIGFVPREPR